MHHLHRPSGFRSLRRNELSLDPQTKVEIDELVTFVEMSGLRSCLVAFRLVEARSVDLMVNGHRSARSKLSHDGLSWLVTKKAAGRVAGPKKQGQVLLTM